MKNLFIVLSVASFLGLAACHSEREAKKPHSKWISHIVEYRPAPGQFINTAIGNPEAAQGIVGGKNGTLSLGGFGGYVIFEFDHEVRNIEGTDFVIFGNAFAGSSEPGIVEVSPNGTDWYRLRGSAEVADETIRDYTIRYDRPAQTETAEGIAWSDNRGTNGGIEVVPFHGQSYWPAFLSGNPENLTFSGVRLPSNLVEDKTVAALYVLQAFEWGYADNWSPDYDAIVGDDPDTRNSNKFDLDWAVDRSGNPVSLSTVRQIKVYTALNQTVGNGLGETSTEVCGALSLSASR